MKRLLIFVILLFGADCLSISYVPTTAPIGYEITKIACFNERLQIDAETSLELIDKLTILQDGSVRTTSKFSNLNIGDYNLVIKRSFERLSWYNYLIVRVTNGDFMVVFEQSVYSGRIYENEHPNSRVAGLERIKASNALQYSLFGKGSESFQVQSNNDGSIAIYARHSLDRELQSFYSFHIKASWGVKQSKASILIIVDDIEDNEPVFEKTQYHKTIPSNLPIESDILTVKAKDADDTRIYYSLRPKHALFQIDKYTGILRLARHGLTKDDKYLLQVQAKTETGKVANPSYIRLNVEDDRSRRKRGIRGEIHKLINETTIGVIHDLRPKGGNPLERYRFKQPKPKEFNIDVKLGEISVAVDPITKTTYLDYETKRKINFTVEIYHNGVPNVFDEQNMSIELQDENDEIPKFKNAPYPFVATVKESAPIGTSIYQLIAEDPDGGSEIRYIMESGGDNRFYLDPITGVVSTIGSGLFNQQSYQIGVSAQDISAPRNRTQKSTIEALTISIGQLKPQFYQISYTASIKENTDYKDAKLNKIIVVQAFSHQSNTLKYDLRTETNQNVREFGINHKTGVVYLKQMLDYERDPHKYHLSVIAEEESTHLISRVSLVISLIDVNDNSPIFPLSQYTPDTVPEDTERMSQVLTVAAFDIDSTTNSRITYTVSDPHFTVKSTNNMGMIMTNKRLDYDRQPNHAYNFTITATDSGRPSLTGEAVVRVTVSNVNDEAPIFQFMDEIEKIERIQVNEDTQAGTTIHVIQAYDPDGDNIKFGFAGTVSLENGPFSLNPSKGTLTLREHFPQRDRGGKHEYRLNISATDDGSCCQSGIRLVSYGTIVVVVNDVNNNAPRFEECSQYQPEVLERSPVGTHVILVKATDIDWGLNGQVTYSLVKSVDQRKDNFVIDEESGLVTTAETFDREEKAGILDFGVTVSAVDRGNPSLAGFCTFRVKIGDINDNSPVFDMANYATSIEQNKPVNTQVIQVHATDKDSKENGVVHYFLRTHSRYFEINAFTGWIQIKLPIIGKPGEHEKLIVEARDTGRPSLNSTAEVLIKIIKSGENNYPQWSDSTIYEYQVPENIPLDHKVAGLSATSGRFGTLVSYVLANGKTPETNSERTFYAKTSMKNEVEIRTYKPLDFEVTSNYILTIRAVNRATHALRNVTRIKITVTDVNDEIPEFIGLDSNGRYQASIAENVEPGTPVITVTATDRDSKPAFQKIIYSLKAPPFRGRDQADENNFDINRHTGEIVTRASSDKFDREVKSTHYVTVQAVDGAPSDRPNMNGQPNSVEAEVVIQITDRNDNPPVFLSSSQTARIRENAEPGQKIIKYTAIDRDHNNNLTYSIVDGNIGNVFEVNSSSGEVFLRGHLDYETIPRYILRYRVFDEKYMSIATLTIEVEDVNDNPPVFERLRYRFDHIKEDQEASYDRPFRIGTVKADDRDRNRRRFGPIRYDVTGQFVSEGFFRINPDSGELYMHRKLDREPPGRKVWNFNVLAYDEPGRPSSLTGYAEVSIEPIDVNDNAPVFQDYGQAIVKENAMKNAEVAIIRATDADEGINAQIDYQIRSNVLGQGRDLFKIDSKTGQILTNVANYFNREKEDKYEITVLASDRGYPRLTAETTVTILVEDINDNSPKFINKYYNATMSEDAPIGASIMSVSARDNDTGENAKLHYELDKSSRVFFKMETIRATNTGVLKVHKQVDYESLKKSQKYHFNLTVEVTDNDLSHRDTAYIAIIVEDANDETPYFIGSDSVKISIPENKAVGTNIANFTAFDKDSGINSQIRYNLERESDYDNNGDPKRFFNISQDGRVRIERELDREFHVHYFINVLAIDMGNPPRTGTTQLSVLLQDINDNAPEFAENYHPIVMENGPPNLEVLRFCAKDKDSSKNGAPFKFSLPPKYLNPTNEDFALEYFLDDRCGRSGIGVITTLKSFDRERQKYYHLPIVMEDSGIPIMTGTTTLTVTIGDENDNDHYPGHKEVTMYSYGDAFTDTPLGYVYAKDDDDWDRTDKEYTFTDDSFMKTFALNKNTGQVHLRRPLSKGSYKFSIRVYDAVKRRTVVSTMVVNVREIPVEAVNSAGSIRLSGTTAEEMIDKMDKASSLYESLRYRLANILKTDLDNVLIFSLKNHEKLKRTTDVSWSAHGSPWYSASKLNGLVDKNRDQLEKWLNVKILQSPVDECWLESVCSGDPCYNEIIINKERPLLVNTNTTSMIGVNVTTKAVCSCSKNQLHTKCQINSCLHGGTCQDVQPYDKSVMGYKCHCLPGFDGPNCEQTVHSFFGEDSFAWYEPLEQCSKSHLSLQFITTADDGLLLYNGPTKSGTIPDDYVIIELRDGLPSVRVNLGQGEARIDVKVEGLTGPRKLNDAHWHKLDLFIEYPYIRLIIDSCRQLTGNGLSDDMEILERDRSICERLSKLPGNSKLLNVRTPLQLGGRSDTSSYPENVYKYGFKGCIKELTVNGRLYDLYIGKKGQSNNSEDGCSREDYVCERNMPDNGRDNKINKCGKNGKCVGSFMKGSNKCVCNAGFRGPRCEKESTPRDFRNKGYLEWRFNDEFYTGTVLVHTERTILQLRFRTRQERGILWTASNVHKSEYVTLEIEKRRLKFKYNAGSGEKRVRIDDIDVADGVWHLAQVERYGGDVWLSLDRVNSIHRHFTGHVNIRLSQGGIFSGGLVKFPRENDVIVEYDYADSCIDDIRYENYFFPMVKGELLVDGAARIVAESNVGLFCGSNGCLNHICILPLHCQDIWRRGKCLCKDGYESYQESHLSDSACKDIDECDILFRPCGLHGSCINTIGSYKCKCHVGWTGEECSIQELADSAFMTTGAVFGIIFCVLAITILVIILITIICSRYRHRNYKTNHINGKTYMHGVDPDDDVRENIIHYEEEAGEDQRSRPLESIALKSLSHPKSIDVPTENTLPKRRQILEVGSDVKSFITNRVQEANNDKTAPPYDTLRPYAFEGQGSVCGSLSSLASNDTDDENSFDYLDEWGPRFQRLNDMYSQKPANR